MKKYVLLLALAVPLKVYADCPKGVERCGTTEDGLTWSVSNIKDENGNFVRLSNGEIAQELKIEGTGDMQEYARSGENKAPWKSVDSIGLSNSAPTIAKITISEGITSIGVRAFEDMSNVKSVSLPEGLTEINLEAFNGCGALSQINLPDSLKILDSYALYGTKISNLILPENLQTIGSMALFNRYLQDITIPEGTSVGAWAFKREGGEIHIETVYCLGTNPSCQALKNQPSMEGRVKFYEKDGDKIFYQGKWYASSNDFATGNHIKKLRYTVEEAMKATEKGDKFHVFITYK